MRLTACRVEVMNERLGLGVRSCRRVGGAIPVNGVVQVGVRIQVIGDVDDLLLETLGMVVEERISVLVEANPERLVDVGVRPALRFSNKVSRLTMTTTWAFGQTPWTPSMR